MQSGWGTERLKFARGHPFKAQGTLGHYVNFAEMLMQIGCMTWAMLLSTAPRKTGLQPVVCLHLCRVDRIALSHRDSRCAGRPGPWLFRRRTGIGWQAFADLGVQRSGGVGSGSGSVDPSHSRPAVAGRTRSRHAVSHHDVGRRLAPDPAASMVRRGHGNHSQSLERVEYSRLHLLPRRKPLSQRHDADCGGARPAGAGRLAVVCDRLFYFLVRLIRKSRPRSRFATGVAAGVLASFVAFQTTALVHYDLGIEPVAMILFFYFGLAIALDRMIQDPAAVDVQ